MEKVYTIFSELLCVIVDEYTYKNHDYYLDEISTAMKSLYINKNTFKYVMERYYSHDRNPFTTAYSQFMSTLSFTTLEKTFKTISEDLLYRLIKEKQSGNEFVVF